MSNFDDDIREFDAKFAAWKDKNPGGTFAEFSAARVAGQIKGGRPHTSLGTTLKDTEDWWKAGASSYRSIKHHHIIRNTDKVIDYGCGSLRIGAHFIKKHYNSLYFGLDVTNDFIGYGLDMLGDLINKKFPKTGTIKNDMDRAIEFGADVIFSANVADQVHPDDVEEYFTNLKRLVTKKESVVIIHAHTSEAPIRFSRAGWARPVAFFDTNMHPLIRIASTPKGIQKVRGQKLPGYLLTYQLPL